MMCWPRPVNATSVGPPRDQRGPRNGKHTFQSRALASAGPKRQNGEQATETKQGDAAKPVNGKTIETDGTAMTPTRAPDSQFRQIQN